MGVSGLALFSAGPGRRGVGAADLSVLRKVVFSRSPTVVVRVATSSTRARSSWKCAAGGVRLEGPSRRRIFVARVLTSCRCSLKKVFRLGFLSAKVWKCSGLMEMA